MGARALGGEIPHRCAQTSCVRFFVQPRIESVAHVQSAPTATVPLCVGERKFTSFHGTVCLPVCPRQFLCSLTTFSRWLSSLADPFGSTMCTPSSYGTVEPLSWQGALRVSARQVIHLHPEFIDCSECEQHLPFALQVLFKERICPSINIPTRE